VRLSVAGANHNRELALKIAARVHHRRGGMPEDAKVVEQARDAIGKATGR
jgi:hypothetical protein